MYGPYKVSVKEIEEITGLERTVTKLSRDSTKLYGERAPPDKNVKVTIPPDCCISALEVTCTELELSRVQVEARPPIEQEHCAFASFPNVMKLLPKINIFPVTYIVEGTTDINVGESNTMMKLALDSAELFGTTAPALFMMTFTALPPNAVPIAIVIFKEVASKRTQMAGVPLTVALHVAAASCAVVMKFAPVTVMVLLM